MKLFTVVFVSMFLSTLALASEGAAIAPIAATTPGLLPGIDYNALSAEDKDLLRKGEISQAQLLAGGFLGTFIGFGSGHLPYEMYGEKGWIFTVGEAGFLTLAVLGSTGIDNDCEIHNNSFKKCKDVSGSKEALVVGAIGFVALRIWEIIDVWTIPSTRNYQVRRIRQKMGRDLTRSDWAIYPNIYGFNKMSSPRLAGLEFSYKF